MYPRTGRLIAVYSIFNAEDLISESMRSLLGVVDEFRIYDGRYKGYRCTCGFDHDNSCDRTLDVVAGFIATSHVTTIVVKLPAMHEYAKRQWMFDDLAVGETALVIDDDELFYGDAQEMRNFCDRDGPQREYKAAYVWELMLGAARQSFIRVHVKTPDLKLVSPENRLDYSWTDYEGLYTPSQVYQMKNARLIHAMASGQPNIPAYRNKAREAAGSRYHDEMAKGLIQP
jgi:hypothetical protein